MSTTGGDGKSAQSLEDEHGNRDAHMKPKGVVTPYTSQKDDDETSLFDDDY
jgi:hypothetical protein